MLTMKSAVVGRPAVVSDDLVQIADQITYERGSFTISQLSSEFSQVSRTLLYEIIAFRLSCHKFCAR
jgi:hypothetical protein